MLRLYPARTVEELEHARILFLEQAGGDDVEELPGAFAPPRGRLLLAEWDGRLAGCVALAPFAGGRCALSCLYVRRGERRRGIGRALAAAVLDEARALGYRAARCSGARASAATFYRALGFVGSELALSTRDR